MANTISTKTWADYVQNQLEYTLRSNLVAEAICLHDTGNSKTINSPFIAAISTTVQALAGTYTVSDFTTTDDTLTVTDEFVKGIHIKDFESVMSNFNMVDSLGKELSRSMAEQVDKYVINSLCADGTGSYTTATGGFTTSANIPKIVADLSAKITGYDAIFNGRYIVVEAADIAGFVQSAMTNGFTYADNALNNGFAGRIAGFDVYTVIDGTFSSSTIGTRTFTNSGHRVAGVKKVSTFATPGGFKVNAIDASGKTGKEVRAYGYVGFKQWTPKAGLTVDITLA